MSVYAKQAFSSVLMQRGIAFRLVAGRFMCYIDGLQVVNLEPKPDLRLRQKQSPATS